MTRADIVALVAEAALAPSVHNVQPARWRIEEDGATLLEDVTRRLPAGDPTGHDAAISLGAAAEGFRLAASRIGRAVRVARIDGVTAGSVRPVARLTLTGPTEPDPLAALVAGRGSYRGRFAEPTAPDRTTAASLAAEDAAVLTDPAILGEAGRRLDDASWNFMRREPFRRELLSWMRLSRRHPDWARDGLNAHAMAMGRVAATGAGLVLGPLYGTLARLGLAKPLISEGNGLAKDVAVILFHRPMDEDPFDSGAHFYRLWLRIEAAGFGAAVLAALADDTQANAWARRMSGLSDDRRLVSAFRIGRRPPGTASQRARLPLEELIVA